MLLRDVGFVVGVSGASFGFAIMFIVPSISTRTLCSRWCSSPSPSTAATATSRCSIDDWVHSAYNVILAFPVIAIGVFDKDIFEEMLLRYSLLYISGRKRADLNVTVLLLEMPRAVLDSLIIFGIPYCCAIEPGDVWGKDAYTDGLWIFGTVVYSALVIAMFVRIAMYIVFLFVYQSYLQFSYNLYGIAGEMVMLPVVWWLLVLVPTGSAVMELTIRLVSRD